MNRFPVHILDEDSLLTTILKENLNKMNGIQTQSFHSVKDFVSNFNFNTYGLVFIDINFGKKNYLGPNSWDLLRILHCNPKLKIVFLADKYDHEIAETTVRMGALDYVVKSNFTIKLIEHIVKQFILTKTEKP